MSPIPVACRLATPLCVILTGLTSRRSCRKIGRGVGSSYGFGECDVPALPVGDDVQEPLGGWHVVGVAGGDGFPGVAGWVGGGDAEGGQEPLLAVGSVVGEGLAGPFAGDQDAAPGVAEAFVSVALPRQWPGRRPGRGFLGWMP